MSRAKERADRIREEVSIVQVLADYGYEIDPAGDYREQQFSCDLHGDGSDSKPSARVYPDSASWYCFACMRSRDAIETVREKEGVEFWQACKLLEVRYGLPELDWGDEEDAPRSALPSVEETFSRNLTYEQERDRVNTLLSDLTADRDMDLWTLMGWWEAYDMITYRVGQGWEEHLGKAAMQALREKKILKRLRGEGEE